MTPLEQMRVRIADLGACRDAQDWMKEIPSDWTPQQAWDSCKKPTWMLWLLGRIKQPDKVKLVRVACAIARTVLHLVPAGEDRPLKAIEAVEAWADNPSDAACAAEAAEAAAYAAARSAARSAAYAAARSAAYAAEAAAAYAAIRSAAYAAEAAAACAAEAAEAAAYAASYAAEAAACDIVRGFFPNPPELD